MKFENYFNSSLYIKQAAKDDVIIQFENYFNSSLYMKQAAKDDVIIQSLYQASCKGWCDYTIWTKQNDEQKEMKSLFEDTLLLYIYDVRYITN